MNPSLWRAELCDAGLAELAPPVLLHSGVTCGANRNRASSQNKFWSLMEQRLLRTGRSSWLLMTFRGKKILSTTVFSAAWVVALVLSGRVLFSYESTPGHVGAVPVAWPQTSRIPPPTDGAVLVMLAHPRCPCTRASMAELKKIMTHLQGKLTAYVLFLKPGGSGPDWDDTGLYRIATGIPGVKVMTDVDGAEAQRFGAETSGQTLLFAPDRRLLFSGGITELRGHEGDNAGEDAIISLVSKHFGGRDRTSVFGCSLFSEQKSKCPK
jgi:hypothetical protein